MKNVKDYENAFDIISTILSNVIQYEQLILDIEIKLIIELFTNYAKQNS